MSGKRETLHQGINLLSIVVVQFHSGALIRDRLIGRTMGFGPINLGSSPSPGIMDDEEQDDKFIDLQVRYRDFWDDGTRITLEDLMKEIDWSKCNCGAGPYGIHARWCALVSES